MIRETLILFCFISSLHVLTQVELKPVVSISNTNSFYVFHKSFNTTYIEQSFLGINTSLGMELSTKKSKINFFVNYQLSGNFIPSDFFGSILNKKFFKYRSHFLGGGGAIIFNRNTRFSPYISFLISSEVSTNSRSAYLNDSYGFRDYPLLLNGYPSPKTEYWSYFYISTPFISSVTGGYTFKINKNFNVNLGVGYGLRIMKTKYAEWKEDEDIYEKLKKVPSETHYFHMLDVQLGLAYSFSFKNKPKPQ
ncbi:hypothetical protein [Brumimicrobium aurantiacum]|uniref:DUF3575 domain-containing protein n=1 Tax=Brumimicrobium aurantiacum TaxID=1737063 RepID=A0A3E1EWY9_9FLAO|nr:hypothetical protein [Brumimicrobium aurantiacum]RFC54067.1 hypothetical protein DXU93_08740 [Brumimicrobium aurantiacum]